MKNFLNDISWIIHQIRGFIRWILIIVFAGTMLSLCTVSMAVASKKAIDAASRRNLNSAVQFVVVFVVLIGFQLFFQAVSSITSTRTHEALSNSLRQKLFAKLMHTEWQSFSKYHSGDILTRMTSDVGTVANVVVNTFPSIISLGIRLVTAFLTLMFFEPILAVSAFALGPVSVLLSRLWAKTLKKLQIKIQEAESAYRSFMHESIQNILVVKTFCIEESSTKKIESLQNDRLGLILKKSRISAISSLTMSFSYWVGYFCAFGLGALRLSQGAATFGTFTAFLQLVGQVQGPFTALAYSLPQIIAASASAGRLKELEKLKLEKITDTVNTWPSAGIKIKDLSFAYDGDREILKNISFRIKPGEIAALVGASGEGKTTLIRLLLALIYPEDGYLYLEDDQGREREITALTRNMVSYVPQGNTLFSGTIADNLRIGCPDATEKEMEEAARAACAWEFIDRLPDKLNTVIGERGIGLSEGQAQRIAIARAFLRKAPIMILDEATSALDTKTEYKVLQAIKSLKPARTCIMITHRPSVLKICNRIIKLEDGCIYEQPVISQANEAIQRAVVK